jgi:tRNA(adenine34) deaminase
MKTKKESKASRRKWSARVKTTSTYPPEGLFTRSAEVIARTLATKQVSPKGPSSGMRMLTFYINRAGKELTESRQKELEKAKRLLSERIRDQKEDS